MKWIMIWFILLFFATEDHAQKTFSVWPGPAPGSELWNWQEQVDSTSNRADPLVFNVAQPTLMLFPADPSVAQGPAVIICPGGSFVYLHVNAEGIELARWLNKRGISAFVLKYRLGHCVTSNPMKEKNERIRDSSLGRLVTPIVPLAIEDAKQAIALVRKRATEFGIDPKKIGILGFSAGGTLAVACSFGYSLEDRPDFVAPIYAFVPPSQPMQILRDEPPVFLVAASDDDLNLVPTTINIYNKWLGSGHVAEMHLYAKGGHGFGMKRQDQPSDTWVDRFADWLQQQGFLNK